MLMVTNLFLFGVLVAKGLFSPLFDLFVKFLVLVITGFVERENEKGLVSLLGHCIKCVS